MNPSYFIRHVCGIKWQSLVQRTSKDVTFVLLLSEAVSFVMHILPFLCGGVGELGVNAKELEISYSLPCSYTDIDGACLSPRPLPVAQVS